MRVSLRHLRPFGKNFGWDRSTLFVRALAVALLLGAAACAEAPRPPPSAAETRAQRVCRGEAQSDPGVIAARRNPAHASQWIGERYAADVEVSNAQGRAFDACMARMGF
jgi:hypothetical protein